MDDLAVLKCGTLWDLVTNNICEEPMVVILIMSSRLVPNSPLRASLYDPWRPFRSMECGRRVTDLELSTL